MAASMSAWKSQQALAVDLAVQHGVAGGALLHELGEEAGLVSGQPLGLHLGEDPLALGLAAPEGDDLVAVDRLHGGVHLEGSLRPGVQDVQVLQAVGGDLGIGGRGLGGGAALADDQLAGADPDRLVGQDVAEGHGPLDRDRLALGRAALVEVGQQPGALRGQARDGGEALLAQAADPFVHGVNLRCVLPVRIPPGGAGRLPGGRPPFRRRRRSWGLPAAAGRTCRCRCGGRAAGSRTGRSAGRPGRPPSGGCYRRCR